MQIMHYLGNALICIIFKNHINKKWIYFPRLLKTLKLHTFLYYKLSEILFLNMQIMRYLGKYAIYIIYIYYHEWICYSGICWVILIISPVLY